MSRASPYDGHACALGCRGFTGPIPPPLWMSVIQFCSTVIKNTSGTPRAPREDALACRTMNQRVLVASNRGPISYQFGADGSLTGRRGGGGMIAGVTDGLAALGDGSSATWICAALSDADRAVARARDTGPRDESLGTGVSVRMLDIAPDTFDRAYNRVANSAL